MHYLGNDVPRLMSRPLAAAQTLGLHPMILAARANTMRRKRVPYETASVAEPFIRRTDLPSTMRAAMEQCCNLCCPAHPHCHHLQ